MARVQDVRLVEYLSDEQGAFVRVWLCPPRIRV